MNATLRLGMLLISASTLSTASPPRIDIQLNTYGTLILRASDRANGTWTLEQSADGRVWAPRGPAFHVRNSFVTLDSGLGNSRPQGRGFYRLVASDETPPKTVSHMLNLPATVAPYAEQSVPPSWLTTRFNAAAINNHAATLGRVLFYDCRLSLDNSVSCASCHRQENAFADNSRFSLGHAGVKTIRNTISLTHVRTRGEIGGFFWDGRRKFLNDAVIDPILHADEMGLSIPSLVEKASAEPFYQTLFTNTFGTGEVTRARIAIALMHFIESMTTFKSRADVGLSNNFADFTERELAGLSLFNFRCARCHGIAGVSNKFANIGLEMNFADLGLGAITHLAKDEGMFLVPSLRQVALTAPYMHDGRFATLREVIDFYDHGVVKHPNLTSPLSGSPMNLSNANKDDLEAFLKTLTDSTIQTRIEFSDPFRTN